MRVIFPQASRHWTTFDISCLPSRCNMWCCDSMGCFFLQTRALVSVGVALPTAYPHNAKYYLATAWVISSFKQGCLSASRSHCILWLPTAYPHDAKCYVATTWVISSFKQGRLSASRPLHQVMNSCPVFDWQVGGSFALWLGGVGGCRQQARRQSNSGCSAFSRAAWKPNHQKTPPRRIQSHEKITKTSCQRFNLFLLFIFAKNYNFELFCHPKNDITRKAPSHWASKQSQRSDKTSAPILCMKWNVVAKVNITLICSVPSPN